LPAPEDILTFASYAFIRLTAYYNHAGSVYAREVPHALPFCISDRYCVALGFGVWCGRSKRCGVVG
jgi:hypothetical protein